MQGFALRVASAVGPALAGGDFQNYGGGTSGWARDSLAVAWPRRQLDQQTKPDAEYGYEYGGFGSSRGFCRDRGLCTTWMTIPADRYEIFAWAAESRSYALGSQWVAGVVTGSTGANRDLKQPPFSYGGQHKYHSGQFRGMNMERSFYWEQLLIDSGLKATQ